MGYFSKKDNWWTAERHDFHKSAVTCCNFDPSGLYVITGSTDLNILILDVYNPEEVSGDNEDYNVHFSKEFYKVRIYFISINLKQILLNIKLNPGLMMYHFHLMENTLLH